MAKTLAAPLWHADFSISFKNQYLQALPTIANGTANKVWVVPAELSKAMENLGSAFTKDKPAG